jgi:outer membrane protein assembly factor BamB
MALANGQYMFSCNPTGKYNLDVPLDENGQITLFAFADGFAPLKYIFTPEGGTTDIDVMMLRALPNSRQMTLTCQFDTAENPGWAKISGQALAENGGTPLCAMVLANGQYTFSDVGTGEYELEVPLDENGQIKLFGFADGFQPFKLDSNLDVMAAAAWPMFGHDARHTGQSPYVGPGNNTLKWKYALIDGVGSASPIIGPDGTIYICNCGVVFALNRDGSLKWRSDVHPGGGGGSTLAISSDDTIYAPFYHSLNALNPDGTLKWVYRSDTEIASSPSIGADGIIYIGCSLDILAIKPDGNLFWKYRVGEDVLLSPAIGQDGTIYVRGRMNFLVALNPDGTEKWTINLGSSLSHTYMSPSIGPDGTIYTFGLMDDGPTTLYAINPNGSVKWVFGDIQFNDETIRMTPSIGQDGTIYLTGSVMGEWNLVVFYAISPSGVLQWTFELPSGDYFSSSSPAIDANGVIYFGTWGNHLYALNPNGTLKWEFETLNNIDSSPAIGSDGTIYFGSWDGYLYAIGE